MVPSKAIIAPRILFILGLALLPSMCRAWPEIYLRPVAQYTWLPGSSHTSEAKHSEFLPGPGYPYEGTSKNYTAASGSLGGGLSLGLALGRERSSEIGVEAAFTRFNGSYITTFPGTSSRPSPRPDTVQSCSISVRTILATYRRFLGTPTDRVRPYLGCAVGSLEYNISEKERPSGVPNSPFNGKYGYLAAGLGGGASIRVGQKTSIEAGYRFMYSANIFGRDDFYRSAHIFNLGLEQRF